MSRARFLINRTSPVGYADESKTSLTAYQVVNHYPYKDLVRIFFKYGEDKFSKQMPVKIGQAEEVSQSNDDRAGGVIESN